VTGSKWSDDNHRYLFNRIVKIKNLLIENSSNNNTSRSPKKKKNNNNTTTTTNTTTANRLSSISTQDWQGEGLPAIEMLSDIFKMSAFEQDLLALCAGFELDSEVSRLCAEVHHSTNAPYPTFGLAMKIFSKPHWSAILPTAPLRRFKLLYVEQGNNSAIASCPLRIDERILHYLMGISYMEEQLRGMIKQVKLDTGQHIVVPSHQNVTDSILQACMMQDQDRKLPIVQLVGKDEMSKQSIANQVCNQLGLSLWRMPADFIPTKADEIESLVELWTRESALLGACLFISAEDADSAAQRSVIRLLEEMPGPAFLSSRERWTSLNSSVFGGTLLSIEVARPNRAEQEQIWMNYLGTSMKGNGLDRDIRRLVDQFNLNTSAIRVAAIDVQMNLHHGSHHDLAVVVADDDAHHDPAAEKSLSSILWEAGRRVARPRMADLAQLITPRAKMDDLILHEKEKRVLRDIILHVRNKEKVYQDWGFESTSSRGLGITALFAGESGTGKTMAAEVLANELELDLFRIDLSMVVSKYIGETEKNLRQVFDAAEDGGAILFFDEADALFGKRSEVHDSHDRYANIEVGYLLQRMESYRGLAILATNIRDAIDLAFMRRIRFVLNFPFPDEKSRAEIWRRVFPKATPTKDLDVSRLAKMSITGGNIRNIALNSCFLAAEEGIAVSMDHVMRAAQSEYDKLERPLTASEMGS